jgi:hypothetical protein
MFSFRFFVRLKPSCSIKLSFVFTTLARTIISLRLPSALRLNQGIYSNVQSCDSKDHFGAPRYYQGKEASALQRFLPSAHWITIIYVRNVSHSERFAWNCVSSLIFPPTESWKCTSNSTGGTQLLHDNKQTHTQYTHKGYWMLLCNGLTQRSPPNLLYQSLLKYTLYFET